MAQATKAFDIINLDSKDPVKQFNCWLQDAEKHPHIKQPNVMCLATSTTDGQPSCRMIQIQEFGHNGFLFFTNYNSKKAKELDSNPKACMCFYWDPLQRQVVVSGTVKKLSQQESIDFFSKQPFEQQIKHAASEQGKVVKGKQELLEKQSELSKKWQSGQNIPRPENWGGYLFVPNEYDFWQGDVNVNDRIRFRSRRDKEDESLITLGEQNWVIERLAP